MDNQASLENEDNSKNQIYNFNLLLPVSFYVKTEDANSINKTVNQF